MRIIAGSPFTATSSSTNQDLPRTISERHRTVNISLKSAQENPQIHGKEEELIEPATPTGQFFNSASLSVSILAALEMEIPIKFNDSQTMSLLENIFIPISSRFSSIMTINDVIVGIIFYGTRLYMEAVSKGSGNAQSTALVLLNTREITSYHTVEEMAKPSTKVPWGNNFGFLHVPVPEKIDVENADPLEFVYEAKKLIRTKKNSLAVYLTGNLLDLMRRLRGPEVSSRYIHKTFWNTSMTISNLIGPVEKMALENHPIKGLYFVVVNSPQNLMISLVSYMGTIRVTVGGEKELINYKLFNFCLEKAFEKIFEAAFHTSNQVD